MSSESTQIELIENSAHPFSPSRRGKGFLAVCGSLFFNGLGHLFAGRYRRGIFWIVLTWLACVILVACAMFRVTLPVLILLIPISAIIPLWCLIDSYLIGRRSPRPMLRHPALRYLAGVAILIASFFINPALWVALQIRSHLIEAFVTPSNSMAPAIATGDRFIVNKKAAYGRWSIVAHDSLGDRSTKWVKRIVGLPGESIDIIDGEMHIDGKPLSRPVEIPPYRDPDGIRRQYNNYPMKLGKDEYFVIGDNSVLSGDSRNLTSSAPGHQRGVIPADYILGPVTAIYWPPRRWRRFD